MKVKIPNLILTLALFCLTIFSQELNQPNWDLTYSSVLKTNKVGSKAWIRKWLDKEYKPPAKRWISEWQGEPIISSILIEYPAFHAAEHSTMCLFRTESRAYYWQDIEDLNGSNIKMDIKTEIFDKILIRISTWKQAKPVKHKDPQSLPGYIGFLNLYEKGKSRQMLLTQEDFIACATKSCKSPKIGRLFSVLEPVIFETEKFYESKEK